MGVVKLVENYAVDFARNSIRDSLQYHGEEAIVLAMYHPGTNTADDKLPRCPYCSDDIYNDADYFCQTCWGTTIPPGVKEARRVWAMFSDQVVSEQLRARGVWAPDDREVQLEAFPLLIERDYVVRVREWDNVHRPTELEGIYGVKAVTRNSMRTGNQFGQWTQDVVGQRVQVSQLAETTGIYRYPIIGETFAAASTNAASAPIPLPLPTSGVGATSSDRRRKYATTIGDGSLAVIDVVHNLGTRDVAVSVYSTSTYEEVECDVTKTSPNKVTLTFADAPPVDAYRVVVLSLAPTPVVIGDGASSAFVVTHNLGTRDVAVSVYSTITFGEVDCDVTKTDLNHVTLTFATPPAPGELRVVVTG